MAYETVELMKAVHLIGYEQICSYIAIAVIMSPAYRNYVGYEQICYCIVMAVIMNSVYRNCVGSIHSLWE